MGARRRGKKGGGEPRFYCESCGMPFYAVKCPSCGHTGRAVDFVEGCPSCGYLAGDGSFVPGESTYTPDAGKGGSAGKRMPAGRAGGGKKNGDMPGWIFFTVLLILGSLFAGIAVLYLNM